jgi:2-dehydro-3-deoxy-D-arabinonate dehydratase
MRLYQYLIDERRAVVAEDGGERFVVQRAASTLELLTRAGASAETLVEVVRRAARRPVPNAGVAGPIIPLEPPEVWGFGVTYKTSAADREEDAREGGDIYARAHAGPRPETFFKATAARCVGPGEEIGIRGDSALTAAEPELAYVVGVGNAVVAYTLGNDVSAWDLERENPLYLPQSKIYTACCALGPCLVTADALDAANVELAMTIKRGGEVAFEGRASTLQLKHPIAYLHEYLTRYNPLPPGSVALTGTGIMTPAGFALREGDEVTVEAEPFGQLVNRARVL